MVFYMDTVSLESFSVGAGWFSGLPREKTAQPKSSILSVSAGFLSLIPLRAQNVAAACALHVSSLFTTSDPVLE